MNNNTKKFNGNDLWNALKKEFEEAIDKYGEVDSHYAVKASYALKKFDVATQIGDYDDCAKYWKMLTKDERLAVLTHDLYHVVVELKERKVLADVVWKNIFTHPEYFGFIGDNHLYDTIPSEFKEWFYNEISCVENNFANREYDMAAGEIRKMAKVWFSKTSNGGCYELTHWGESPITSDEEMRNIINKSYNRSLAEKILELLNIASMGFVTSGVRNLTQFKEWWAYCFRPLLAA